MAFNIARTAGYVEATAPATSNVATPFSANDAGNLLVVIWQSVHGVATIPSATCTDSAGNTYQVAFTSTVSNVSSRWITSTIFYCQSAKSSGLNTVTVHDTLTGALMYGVVAGEFTGSNIGVAVDGAGVAANIAGASQTINIPSHVGALVVAFSFTDSEYNGGQNTTINAPFNSFGTLTDGQCGGWYVTGTTPNTGATFNYSLGNRPGLASGVAFLGSTYAPVTGGPATGRIAPGPKYKFECLPNGRKSLALTFDCSQLPVVNGVIALPEFSDLSGTAKLAGYTSQTIDIANCVNGSGLEEIRSIIAYSRPLHGAIFDGSPSVDDCGASATLGCPAIITALGTGQSVLLGAGAVALQKSGAIEHLVMPFPVSGSALTVRFLAPQATTVSPRGLYTILFTNFDCGSAFAQAGFFGPSTQ